MVKPRDSLPQDGAALECGLWLARVWLTRLAVILVALVLTLQLARGSSGRVESFPMRKLLLALLLFGAVVAIARTSASTEDRTDYSPLKAAPDQHKTVFENAFVLVLDVSIPAGVTVPAHVHPWPAVFITLQPAHLVFRNLAGAVVREVEPPLGPTGDPKVEWRESDTQPASVTNVDANPLRALRIELKFLAGHERGPTSPRS